MEPIPVPKTVIDTRPECRLVDMGKPAGVADEDCGSAQMLVSPNPAMPGYDGHSQYAYFKPTKQELEQLNDGGFLEMNQIGAVVQPFALNVWPGPSDAPEDGDVTP